MTMRKFYLIFTLLALCGFTACGSDDGFDVSTPPLPEIDPTPPAAENLAPIAFIILEPETATPDQLMTLNGKGSYDPDKGILTYKWTQLEGTPVTLDADDQPVATFTVPNADTTLVFQLIVTDPFGLSSDPVEVEIPVVATVGTPPPLTAIVVSSIGGDDSQNGSFDSPVATIQRGVALAAAGGVETVYVMIGTYDEAVELPGNIQLIGDVVSFDSYGSPAFSTAQGQETFVSSINITNAASVTIKYIEVTGTAVVTASNNIRFEGVSFSAECNGACDTFTALQFTDSASVEVSGSIIENNPQTANTFTGIVVQDTTNARIHDNFISITGAKTSTGVSLRCVDAAINPVVEKNSITIAGGSTEATAVRINCPQNGASFGVYKNRMNISAAANQPAKLSGIEATSLKRNITLKGGNNVIAMTMATTDAAAKTAIKLVKLGVTSDITFAFNTLYIAGGKNSELHALSSDLNDVPFSLLGNISMVYGSFAANAHLTVKSVCGAAGCAKEVANNLFNSKLNNKVSLIYYYDAPALVDVGDNINGQPGWHDNISDALTPNGFDLAGGDFMLTEADQELVIDKGPTLDWVIDDINGTPRGEMPDIGAVEYE